MLIIFDFVLPKTDNIYIVELNRYMGSPLIKVNIIQDKELDFQSYEVCILNSLLINYFTFFVTHFFLSFYIKCKI